jgi:hypothetical protein
VIIYGWWCVLILVIIWCAVTGFDSLHHLESDFDFEIENEFGFEIENEI